VSYTRSLFELPGPQLSDPESGPEPTLEALLEYYYASHFGGAELIKARESYIRGWFARNTDGPAHDKS